MNKIKIIILSFLITGSIFAQQKPNIIYILVDDMGYGDIGVFFQNQRMKTNDRSKPYQITPCLDAMATSGVMFTQQYCNAPVCAPSRGSLMTGTNQGNANVRDNQFDKALEDNHTLGTVLREAGYSTMAIGKWGLQGGKETGSYWPAHPLKRGFDSYYGYMRHVDGHEHYPHEGLYRGKKEVYDNYINVAEGLAKCYTTDLWTAMAKKRIIDHQKSKEALKPFFMYLAYDAPHAVLELPTQEYPKGRGINGGLQWLGTSGKMINTASGTPDSYVHADYVNATYDDDNNPATKEVSWPDTYKRYATANRRIDDAVGDILQLLKDLKIDENTLVVFSSDNGASIESYLPSLFVGFKPTFFASNGAFDGIKRDCWEGGVRMPVLANWPKHIPAGKIVSTPSMLSDWMATFAEVAGIRAPARTDGVSLLPSLIGKGKQERSFIYIEYFESGNTPDFKEYKSGHRSRKRGQMQLIRMDDYKGVRYDIKSAEDDFEIYNVISDPQERNNLATQPGFDKLQLQMKAGVLQTRHADIEAPRPYDNALIPSVEITGKLSSGLSREFFKGNFSWVISEKGLTGQKQDVCFSITETENKIEKGMVCYKGFVKIPADGQYSFSLKTSGKAYVRLHGASLFDADFGYRPDKELFQDVNLKKGYHPVSIYLLKKNKASETISIKWKSKEAGQWKDLKGDDLVHQTK